MMHRTKGQDSTRNSGFTILELMVVVIVLGIISALALPQALIGVKAYRLHSNAAGFAGHLNLARYRATSQYAPYRVRISTSVVPHQFSLERLCGGTSSSVDSNCSSAYQARTNGIEGGSLPLERGNVFTTTNPGGTTSYPGTITGGSASTGANLVVASSVIVLPANYDRRFAWPRRAGPAAPSQLCAVTRHSFG